MMRDAAFEDKGRLADSADPSYRPTPRTAPFHFRGPLTEIPFRLRAFLCSGGVTRPLKEDA